MADCKYEPTGTLDTDGETRWHYCHTHGSHAIGTDTACAGNDDSPAHVADLWTWDEDYGRAWARTVDPRVLAIIQRDDGAHAPSGHVFAPAYFVDRGRARRAGDTYRDAESDNLAERYAEAREFFVNWHYGRRDGHRQLDYDAVLARWLRIFHDASAVEVRSTVHQGSDSILLLDTPGWREHTGATEPTTWTVTSVTAPGENFAETTHDDPELTEAAARALHLTVVGAEGRRITACERVSILAGDVETWQDYLDGDVFGIGYATIDDGAATSEDDVDLDVTHDVTMTSWGLYGEEDAQRAALEETLFSAADDLKEREEREAETARELAEAAERGREAAVDRLDIAMSLKGLDALIQRARDGAHQLGDALTIAELGAYALDHWPAAARFVEAATAESEAQR